MRNYFCIAAATYVHSVVDQIITDGDTMQYHFIGNRLSSEGKKLPSVVSVKFLILTTPLTLGAEQDLVSVHMYIRYP